jgi:hypothetical protein
MKIKRRNIFFMVMINVRKIQNVVCEDIRMKYRDKIFLLPFRGRGCNFAS